jgi:DDE superfamily endonuclease
VWAHDQARRGLKPIIRRVWARRGQRPLALSTHRYEWSYVYGFVHPADGRTQWLILPMVNTEAMQAALMMFAQAQRLGPRKQVVLVLDGAPWHRTPNLLLPPGVHLEFLPPCTPELQPAERLWPALNEGVANRPFATVQGLERALVRRCRQLLAQPDRIRDLTHYAWWPEG